MPELPDITVYLDALDRRVPGKVLERVPVGNPFVLRTALPPIQAIEGRRVETMRRLGKRIVLGFGGDLWLVIHLMIAGRLLADRSLSRLLKADWPRTIDEAEADPMFPRGRAGSKS